LPAIIPGFLWNDWAGGVCFSAALRLTIAHHVSRALFESKLTETKTLTVRSINAALCTSYRAPFASTLSRIGLGLLPTMMFFRLGITSCQLYSPWAKAITISTTSSRWTTGTLFIGISTILPNGLSRYVEYSDGRAVYGGFRITRSRRAF
jgi:hypothetical protein